MTTIEKAREMHRQALAEGCKPGHFHCLVAPATITKKDWLMCPACGMPQHLLGGADEEYDPAVFRTDRCIFCCFPIVGDVDPAKYDVVAGRAKTRPTGNPAHDWIIDSQADALCRYEDAPQG